MSNIIDIDPSFLKYINNQRVKMLELIVNGINDINELSYRMFVGKNIVKRHAKLLESLGLVKLRSNSIELNITPRSLAILLTLNIISLSKFFMLLKKYLLSTLNRKYRVAEEDIVFHFLSDGGVMIESHYKMSEYVKNKIAEHLLKNTEFIYVSFLDSLR